MFHGYCERKVLFSLKHKALRFYIPFVSFVSSLLPPGEDNIISSINETISALSSIENHIHRLQICKERKDPSHVRHVYSLVCNDGLDSQYAIGGDLVLAFVLSGNVVDAHRVYKKLCIQNVRLCTSLMWGYLWFGEKRMVFCLYKEMVRQGVMTPNTYTFVALLSACNELQDAENGRMIHGHIVQMGYDGHPFVGSMLLDMYAKLGLLCEGLKVFYRMSIRDVVAWSTLIAGYAKEGLLSDVMVFFNRRQMENISPNVVTFLATLKACNNAMNIDKGREFHNEIVQRGFETEIAIGNNLVDMYSKNGSIDEAKKVFNSLIVKDDVAWSALIGGYAEAGLDLESMSCFYEMHNEGICINMHGFSCILKACGNLEALNKGQEIHMIITKVGFDEELYVGNALVDMYAKCGWIFEAERVFDKLAYHDVVSWNALMTGYSEYGLLGKLLDCFQKMKAEQVTGDPITFACTLKCCGNMGSLQNGREIHVEVMYKTFDGVMLVIGALVDVYAKCRSLADAQKIFDSLPTQSIVLWNSLIAGYANQGHVTRVLECLCQMRAQRVIPNHATYVYVVKSCSNIGSIDRGRAIYIQIELLGLEKDHHLGIMLVEMYAKSGLLEEALDVFNNIENRKDVLSWNVLIDGYAEHGPNQSVIDCVKRMQQDGVVPDMFTFSCIIKACSNLGLVDMGKDFYTEIICKGFETDIVIGTTLMDMYRKYDLLAETEKVFKKLPKDNVITWNTAILSYCECGYGEMAWHCFEDMGKNCVSGDATSYVGILKACIIMAALEKGKLIHEDIVVKGLEGNTFIGSALIAMYSKCGKLPEGRAVFEKFPSQNVVMWNSMVKGYCLNHESEMAMRLFQAMQDQGVQPDATTFTCLITACGRMSLVHEGQAFFNHMEEIYGINPNIDHFSCMVDLLGRSGNLSEAEKLLQTMPCYPARNAQRALLTACKTFKSSKMGERCHEQLVY